LTTCNTRRSPPSSSAAATPVIQILQDFGIMELDDILQVMAATALGTEVVSLKDRELTPELLKLIPAKWRGCINACRWR
jgi:hypothetical protein